jgi:hypothetical protein
MILSPLYLFRTGLGDVASLPHLVRLLGLQLAAFLNLLGLFKTQAGRGRSRIVLVLLQNDVCKQV